MIRFKTSRGAPGVALVEIDGRRVGSVRRFHDGMWRAKLDAETGYEHSKAFRTRAEAGAAVNLAAMPAPRREAIERLNVAIAELDFLLA